MVDLVRVNGVRGVDGTNTSFGPNLSISRVLPVRARALDGLIFQQGMPGLDSELHLLQALLAERQDQLLQQLSLVGWTQRGAVDQPTPFHLRVADSYLLARGAVFHIADPDQGYYSTFLMNAPPPTATRIDLVFLEFWYAEVGPPTAAGPPGLKVIYKEGGVANATWPNDMVDPVFATETSRRIQRRWRWRVVNSASALTDAAVGAQGDALTPQAGTTYQFTLVPAPQAPGQQLYRAGDGSVTAADAMDCLDGYSYAVPAFTFLRRAGETSVDLSTLVDLRGPAGLFIPNRSIHTLQIALGTDALGAGVEGQGGTNGSNIKPGSLLGGAAGDIGAATVDTVNLKDGAITNPKLAPLAVTDAKVAAANIDGLVGVPSLRTLGPGAQQAAPGNDARLSDSRVPKGAAGGDVTGTYPSALAVQKGGAANLWALRQLGTASDQACAGNDGRLSDPRAPTGGATGVLTGFYPNPGLADQVVTAPKIVNYSVIAQKIDFNAVLEYTIALGAVTSTKIADKNVLPQHLAKMPSLRVHLHGNVQVDGVLKDIPWDTLDWDTSLSAGGIAMWDSGSPATIYLPAAGIYLITASVLYSAPVNPGGYGNLANSVRDLAIIDVPTGSQIRMLRVQPGNISNVDVPTLVLPTQFRVTPTDLIGGARTIKVQTYQTSGQPWYISDGGVTGATQLEVTWIAPWS